MDGTQLLGMLIPAIITLITCLTAITNPLIKLNSTLTKLNLTVDGINKENLQRDNTLKEHDSQIKQIRETQIDHQSRIKSIEHEVFK